MKRHFISALNTAATVMNSASGLFQELTMPGNEVTNFRFRLAPYGEHPGKDLTGKDIIQVVDRESAQILAANYQSLGTKLAGWFRGVPIYEGHADDPGWSSKNPGHKASAVGRIKSIEAGDDGIYAVCSLNAAGVQLLGGDAPAYTGHSPYWRLAPIANRAGAYRPILLWSTALTNTPNIPGNSIALNSSEFIELDDIDEALTTSPSAGQPGETENQETSNTTMKLTPEALAALGFAPDADPSAEEINAAILKLATPAEAPPEPEKAKEEAEEKITAANSRADQLQKELDQIQGIRTAAIDTVITDAINTGRITDADKAKWTDALNTDFVGESAKLSKLMPVISTGSKLKVVDRDRAPGMVDAVNTAEVIKDGVTAYAKEQGIDISTNAGWDKAYNAFRSAKPEVFNKG